MNCLQLNTTTKLKEHAKKWWLSFLYGFAGANVYSSLWEKEEWKRFKFTSILRTDFCIWPIINFDIFAKCKSQIQRTKIVKLNDFFIFFLFIICFFQVIAVESVFFSTLSFVSYYIKYSSESLIKKIVLFFRLSLANYWLKLFCLHKIFLISFELFQNW